MINFSISKFTIRLEEWKSLDNKLFDARIEQVIQYYLRIFNGSLFLYSQLIEGITVQANENQKKIHVHFVRTNGVYSMETINEAIKRGLFLEKVDDYPKETTHIIILDIFGRISKILPLYEGKSLLKAIYGESELLSFRSLDTDEPKSNIVLPFGNLVSATNLLQIDQLGFRNTFNILNIFDKQYQTNTINVAVVGGSFCSAIYSITGESFVEILEPLLNNNTITRKKVKLWNFSQPGHLQSDSLSVLINTGVIRLIDYVIWIDGLNDLCASIPASAFGLNNIYTLLPAKFNGISFSKEIISSTKCSDTIESYITYRNESIRLLEGVGVKSINILQPLLDLNSDNHSLTTKSLLPYAMMTSWKDDFRDYVNLQQYIKSIASSKYNIIFEIIEPNQQPFEFWDFAHLSPVGEYQFAHSICSIISGYLNPKSFT